MRNLRFAHLLKEGFASVAHRQNWTKERVRSKVTEELMEAGYTLKRSTVDGWCDKGIVPGDPQIVARLTRFCKRLGMVNEEWARSFLLQARYPDREALLRELFEDSDVKTSFLPPLPLNWERLREITWKYSQLQMTNAREKYAGRLYVERIDMNWIIEDFLELRVTQRALVITGDAGIGKTNILFHHYERLDRYPDIALLWLEGARLNTRQSLVQTLLNILQELAREDQHPTSSAEDDARRLHRLLEGLQAEQTLILIVDGVHEAEHPLEAFKCIDDFVDVLGSQAFRCMKVILTANSHMWDYAMQFVPKPHRIQYYYGAQPKGAPAVRSRSSITHRLESFTPQEQRRAFELYSREEGILVPPLDSLDPPLREALKHPYLLSFCKAYWEGTIRPGLPVDDIIPELISWLIEERNLRQPYALLEDHLLPQFFPRAGMAVNRLSSDRLHSIRIGEVTLYEMVADRTPPETPIKQQFDTLVGVGWLVGVGGPLDYELRFRDEYLYNYFAARYLIKQRRQQGDRLAFFETWIGVLEQAPFLWGPLFNMLLSLFREGKSNLIRQVILSPRISSAALPISATSLRQSLLISVLVKAYAGEGQEVKMLAKELLEAHQTKQQGFFAPTIGLEVAADATVRDAELLVAGLCHRNPDLRSLAIQRVFQLWMQQDATTTLQVLKGSLEHIKPSRLWRAKNAFTGAFHLTLLMALSYYEQPSLRRHLAEVLRLWRPVVRRFRVLVGTNPMGQRHVPRVRRWITRLFSWVLRRAAANVDNAHHLLFSFSEVATSFPLDPRRKENVRQLLPYFDAAFTEPLSTEVLVVLCRAVLRSQDMLTTCFAFGALTATFIRDPLKMRPVVEELYRDAVRASKELTQVPMLTPYLTMIAQNADYQPLKRLGQAEDVLHMYGELVKNYELGFHGTIQGQRGHSFWWSELAAYSVCYYRVRQELISPVMQQLLDHIVEEKSVEKLRFLTRRFGHVARSSLWQAPEVGLAGLKEIILRLTPPLEAKLEKDLAESLAIIRAINADLVDEGMQSLINDRRLSGLRERLASVHAQSKFLRPPVNLGYLMGDAFIIFIGQWFKDQNSRIRDFVKDFLLQVTESESLEDWLALLALKLVDLELIRERREGEAIE